MWSANLPTASHGSRLKHKNIISLRRIDFSCQKKNRAANTVWVFQKREMQTAETKRTLFEINCRFAVWIDISENEKRVSLPRNNRSWRRKRVCPPPFADFASQTTKLRFVKRIDCFQKPRSSEKSSETSVSLQPFAHLTSSSEIVSFDDFVMQAWRLPCIRKPFWHDLPSNSDRFWFKSERAALDWARFWKLT